MKKVLLSIILLIAVVQGTWATAYKYYIVEKSGSTLFFKGSDTAPSGKFQWNITDNSQKKWTWLDEDLRGSYTKAVFEPSFAEARPTNMESWFFLMNNLEKIEGLQYLNTSMVARMDFLFAGCEKLTELNLIYFNTSNVESMAFMFMGCKALKTIYVGDGWDTSKLTYLGSGLLFTKCESLVGETGAMVDLEKVETQNAANAYVGKVAISLPKIPIGKRIWQRISYKLMITPM